MKITKRQLKRIIREEFTKLLKEDWDKETFGGRSHQRKPVATYGQRLIDARKGNRLPPQESNWYSFAKAMDIGVLDLDELAFMMRYKDFATMDAAMSPRGLSQDEAEELAEHMYEINEASETDVFDALDASYGWVGNV